MVRCGIPGMKTIRYHPFTCNSRLVHYTLFLFLHVKVEALLGRGWVFVLDCGLIYGAGGAVSARHAWMARLVRLAPRTLIRERKKHQPTGNHFARVLKCCRFFMKTHKLSSYFQIAFFAIFRKSNFCQICHCSHFYKIIKVAVYHLPSLYITLIEPILLYYFQKPVFIFYVSLSLIHLYILNHIQGFRMAFYISYKHSRTMYVVPMERFNSNRWFQRYQNAQNRQNSTYSFLKTCNKMWGPLNSLHIYWCLSLWFGFDNILEVTYLTFKSIFHKALIYFSLKPFLEPTSTKHCKERVKFLAQWNTGGLWWGSNPQPPHYEADLQPTAPRHPFWVLL